MRLSGLRGAGWLGWRQRRPRGGTGGRGRDLEPTRSWPTRRRIGLPASFCSSFTPLRLCFAGAASFARGLPCHGRVEPGRQLGRAFTAVRGGAGWWTRLNCARGERFLCGIERSLAQGGIHRRSDFWARHGRRGGGMVGVLMLHAVKGHFARVERATCQCVSMLSNEDGEEEVYLEAEEYLPNSD